MCRGRTSPRESYPYVGNESDTGHSLKLNLLKAEVELLRYPGRFVVLGVAL
jgi:hypothetical protein